MAWHDRGWDGHVCDDPAANTYCSGSHSLLSERLAREKKIECETPCRALDADLPGYQPPCFWTSSAFATNATQTLHRHPFSRLSDKKQIVDELPANTVYTWPFRLSITHNSKEQHGQYFPDLEQRIERYRGRLSADRSLIFLYLNYDNPISADEYKYALVGCVRLKDIKDAGTFQFDEKELEKLRSQSDSMKNFPVMNWALKLEHHGKEAGVVLPYHVYLKHIETHPDDETKLEEIRVLIDDPALLPRFKYVSEQVHDDHALNLLYKLRRALQRAEAHGIADVGGAIDRLEDIIADCWADRSLYPGLGSIVTALADLSEGEVQPQGEAGQAVVAALRASLPADVDLAETLFAHLSEKGTPDVLAPLKPTWQRARAGFRDNASRLPLLRKLALFTLTPRQIGRILFTDSDGGSTFGGLAIGDDDIAANPYLLAESYIPTTTVAAEERADLDREQRSDSPIDYAVIDIGMFPDFNHMDRHEDLHDLTVAGPERLRAFSIEALRSAEAAGHSFLSQTALVEHAAQHPLFYREKLAISPAQLLSSGHLAHFRERLHVEVVDGAHYFYRQSTWNAEQTIMRVVSERLALPTIKADSAWIEGYVANEVAALSAAIGAFDAELFAVERTRLMTGALAERFYCATGRPGSGKSQALLRLLKEFEDRGETTLVLAPTGKAALRLNQERGNAAWEAQTIDRWIWRSGLGRFTDEDADLAAMVRSGKLEPFDNLVVEESSMVNLFQLALIFRAIEVHQPTLTKRLILVGDENQLPPIGCGKPLQDILTHLRANEQFEKNNHVRLITNCRQKHDPKVIEAAHLFAGRNRYHSELFDAMCKGGKISDFLTVRYFDNTDELHGEVENFIDGVLDDAVPGHAEMPRQEAYNLLLNLYENGNVKGFKSKDLALDRAQVLSPYRGGISGTLGLSQFVASTWRADVRDTKWGETDGFFHSDKLVRVTNYYTWNSGTKTRDLRLSNGSIGVLSSTRKSGWQGFFPESNWSLDWKKMQAEDFELAYALTVHKAQGSEFAEVLMVVPERRALLSSELLYTGMTRSQGRLTLLVERSDRANPLRIARDRSVLAMRNSSVFSAPFDSARLFEPEPGVRVRSKIEYMVYSSLVRAREEGKLSFAYEEPMNLPFGDRTVSIRPDFTIQTGGKTFFWEHLGMLDRQDYARDWRERRRAYEVAGLADALITTDDATGVRSEILNAAIADLCTGTLAGRRDLGFSDHHYQLGSTA
ncbi:hypothetical protein CDQ92_19830 [Sphingopyxis bauzanensis]|uniref:UvrD-like helicase C-terminal domain-containing protein n=2 Tax=Sphingopyxis bauzanensis TaxID=651663 RepID=A0A246JJT8_9SPHN|nr:hypothetical protein CDQ92_19830 [Sphingopyxis bauzanensis]